MTKTKLRPAIEPMRKPQQWPKTYDRLGNMREYGRPIPYPIALAMLAGVWMMGKACL